LTPRLIDAVIVPSQSLKKQLLTHGFLKPDEIEVIPIGVEDVADEIKSESAGARVREQFGFPPQSRIAVTVGRFVEQKGHRYLVEAMPELAGSFPELRFLFLGNGPLEESLRTQATELGVSGVVKFGGMQESVAPILAGCDLMIHPSIEEPFGIAIVEGMRAGLPVVASHVGGIPEVLGDSSAGTLVEVKSPAAIVKGVAEILIRSEHPVSYGEENRARYELMFTLDRMICRIEQYLESVCRKAAARG
jgi:glycosyltransferase involved in cell wall biosynthesis